MQMNGREVMILDENMDWTVKVTFIAFMMVG